MSALNLLIKNTDGRYETSKPLSTKELIKAVSDILMKRFEKGAEICSPAASTEFLKLALGAEERENLAVIYLTNSHRVISYEVLFQGSISSASIAPREIVKRGLALNAAACILSHNHPSGNGKSI